MKKLLHVQLLPLMSGVQRFSLYLLEGLDKSEFDIWVACAPGGEFVEEIRKRGYHYLPLPWLKHRISLLDIPAFVHFILLMKRHRFDIVHTHSSKPGMLGRLAARLCKVPLIVHTAHGTAFQAGQPLLKRTAFMALEALGNSWGHHTVFVNDSDRLQCLKLRLVPLRKASTIYNALPPVQGTILADMAAKRTVPQNEVIIGSTLRFSQQKNVINLVVAACKACARNPRLKFILVGDGEHEALCRTIVASYKLNDRIIMPGWDSEVLPWLRVFHVFVLFSRWEAMPFSIIEAMASGLAVIGSEIPSIAELVNERTGWLLPLERLDLLESTFEQVADNPQEAFAKGQLAVREITAKCDYTSMVAGYRKLYLSRGA